jgi:hypothetical protein
MIIDDKHAARPFLLDRPLAAPVRVLCNLWNGPPFFRQRSLAGGSNGGVDHEDCGVIFREDGYTNRGDNAPRNIFSLIGFALKFLKSISPFPTCANRTISGRQEQDTSPVLRLKPHPFC